MTPMRTLVALLLSTTIGLADETTGEKGELLFEDSFERSELGPRWLVPIKEFSVRNGQLRGREDPSRGHGAVVRAPLKFSSAIFEFSFRLTDNHAFNFVINDKHCKEVHAGHICRVSFSTELVRIADDREGAMKNEIFALLRDPKQKTDRREILKDRERLVPNQLSAGDWHHARVSVVGEEMSVIIDDKLIGSLKSSGIAHPTKTDFGFTVTGDEIEFDDVRVWTAPKSRKFEVDHLDPKTP